MNKYYLVELDASDDPKGDFVNEIGKDHEVEGANPYQAALSFLREWIEPVEYFPTGGEMHEHRYIVAAVNDVKKTEGAEDVAATFYPSGKYNHFSIQVTSKDGSPIYKLMMLNKADRPIYDTSCYMDLNKARYIVRMLDAYKDNMMFLDSTVKDAEEVDLMNERYDQFGGWQKGSEMARAAFILDVCFYGIPGGEYLNLGATKDKLDQYLKIRGIPAIDRSDSVLWIDEICLECGRLLRFQESADRQGVYCDGCGYAEIELKEGE